VGLQALLWALLGLIGGALVSVQVPMNTVLQRYVGFWEGILIVNLTGAAVAGVMVLVVGRGSLQNLPQAPLYSLLGGALGVAIVALSTFIVPHIGVLAAVSIFITGQLFTALMVDTFGAVGQRTIPLSWGRLVGMALLLLGAWLALR
jgi:transporter family-2 protein